MEHVISPYFEERLAQLLGEPAFDPHGEPIPDRELRLTEDVEFVRLSDLQPGQRGVARRVSAERDKLLAYLGSVGVQPGVTIELLQRNPFDGALSVQIGGGSEQVVFSQAISQSVWLGMEKYVGDHWGTPA